MIEDKIKKEQVPVESKEAQQEALDSQLREEVDKEVGQEIEGDIEGLTIDPDQENTMMSPDQDKMEGELEVWDYATNQSKEAEESRQPAGLTPENQKLMDDALAASDHPDDIAYTKKKAENAQVAAKLSGSDNIEASKKVMGLLRKGNKAALGIGSFAKALGGLVIKGASATKDKETYLYGTEKTVNALLALGPDVVNFIGVGLDMMGIENVQGKKIVELMKDVEAAKIDLINDEDASGAQKFMGRMATLMFGFVAIRSTTNVASLWREGKTLQAVGKEVGLNGLVDFLLTDKEDENVANFLQDYSWAKTLYLDMLATDVNDTELEKRIKNGVIGGALGGAIDGGIITAKNIKHIASFFKLIRMKASKENFAFKRKMNAKGIGDEEALAQKIAAESGTVKEAPVTESSPDVTPKQTEVATKAADDAAATPAGVEVKKPVEPIDASKELDNKPVVKDLEEANIPIIEKKIDDIADSADLPSIPKDEKMVIITTSRKSTYAEKMEEARIRRAEKAEADPRSKFARNQEEALRKRGEVKSQGADVEAPPKTEQTIKVEEDPRSFKQILNESEKAKGKSTTDEFLSNKEIDDLSKDAFFSNIETPNPAIAAKVREVFTNVKLKKSTLEEAVRLTKAIVSEVTSKVGETINRNTDDLTKLFTSMLDDGFDLRLVDMTKVRQFMMNNPQVDIVNVIKQFARKETSKKFKELILPNTPKEIYAKAKAFIRKLNVTDPALLTKEDFIAVNAFRKHIVEKFNYDVKQLVLLRQDVLDGVATSAQYALRELELEKLLRSFDLFESSVWRTMDQAGHNVKLFDLHYLHGVSAGADVKQIDVLDLSALSKVMKGDKINDLLKVYQRQQKLISKVADTMGDSLNGKPNGKKGDDQFTFDDGAGGFDPSKKIDAANKKAGRAKSKQDQELQRVKDSLNKERKAAKKAKAASAEGKAKSDEASKKSKKSKEQTEKANNATKKSDEAKKKAKGWSDEARAAAKKSRESRGQSKGWSDEARAAAKKARSSKGSVSKGWSDKARAAAKKSKQAKTQYKKSMRTALKARKKEQKFLNDSKWWINEYNVLKKRADETVKQVKALTDESSAINKKSKGWSDEARAAAKEAREASGKSKGWSDEARAAAKEARDAKGSSGWTDEARAKAKAAREAKNNKPLTPEQQLDKEVNKALKEKMKNKSTLDKAKRISDGIGIALAMKVVSPIQSLYNATVGSVHTALAGGLDFFFQDALTLGQRAIRSGGDLFLPKKMVNALDASGKSTESHSVNFAKMGMSAIYQMMRHPITFLKNVDNFDKSSGAVGTSMFFPQQFGGKNPYVKLQDVGKEMQKSPQVIAQALGYSLDKLAKMFDLAIGGKKLQTLDSAMVNTLFPSYLRRNVVDWIRRKFPHLEGADLDAQVNSVYETVLNQSKEGDYSSPFVVDAIEHVNQVLLRSNNAGIIGTQNVNVGKVLKEIQNGLFHVPVVGPLMTIFTKVITNSADQLVQRTPGLNLLNPGIRDEWAKYGSKRVIAKSLTGMTIAIGGIALMNKLKGSKTFVNIETKEQSMSFRNMTGISVQPGDILIIDPVNSQSYLLDRFDPIASLMSMWYKIAKSPGDLKSNQGMGALMADWGEIVLTHVSPDSLFKRYSDFTENLSDMMEGKGANMKFIQSMIDAGSVKEWRDYRRGYTSAIPNSKSGQLDEEYKQQLGTWNLSVGRFLSENLNILGTDEDHVQQHTPMGESIGHLGDQNPRKGLDLFNLSALLRGKQTLDKKFNLELYAELSKIQIHDSMVTSNDNRSPINLYPSNVLTKGNILSMGNNMVMFNSDDNDEVGKAIQDLSTHGSEQMRRRMGETYKFNDRDYQNLVKLSAGKNLNWSSDKGNFSVNYLEEAEKFVNFGNLDMLSMDGSADSIMSTFQTFGYDKGEALHSVVFNEQKNGMSARVSQMMKAVNLDNTTDEKTNEMFSLLFKNNYQMLVQEDLNGVPQLDYTNSPDAIYLKHQLMLPYLSDEGQEEAKATMRSQVNKVSSDYNNFGKFILLTKVLPNTNNYSQFMDSILESGHDLGKGNTIDLVFPSKRGTQ